MDSAGVAPGLFFARFDADWSLIVGVRILFVAGFLFHAPGSSQGHDGFLGWFMLDRNQRQNHDQKHVKNHASQQRPPIV